ncbi:hypothetical protein [Streptomyces neyagawaensis]|uniref:Secreted protein n=1 Tax=Streptomyces neyagawaensis TaxID=42238 RepID=A0ABV3B6F9_9ACTN
MPPSTRRPLWALLASGALVTCAAATVAVVHAAPARRVPDTVATPFGGPLPDRSGRPPG